MEGYKVVEHIVLEHNDMKICNSAGAQNVAPVSVARSTMEDGKVTSRLGKVSWNVIRLKKQ
jgi:alpha-N-arabinofuranosidase